MSLPDGLTGPVPPSGAGARCTPAHCPLCGTRTHQHPDPDGHTVVLQPGEFPARELPEHVHHHLNRGIVYPGSDPREYGLVRIRHDQICPARERPIHTGLATLWRYLAIRYRRDTHIPAYEQDPRQSGQTGT